MDGFFIFFQLKLRRGRDLDSKEILMNKEFETTV